MKDWSDIGARLRAARTASGASLQDVAHHTRIPVQVLRSLEDHCDACLPSAAYTRGFLSQYADHLELDAAEWIEELEVADTFADLDQHSYLRESTEVFGEAAPVATPKPRRRPPRRPAPVEAPASSRSAEALQPLTVFSLTAVLMGAAIYGFLHISDQIEQASFNNARKDLASSPVLAPLPSVVPSRPALPTPRAKPINTTAPAVAEVVPEGPDNDNQPQLVIESAPPRAILIEE